GGLESSSTRSHFTVQSISAAAAPQKPAGSASERACASAQLGRFSATRSCGWGVSVRARSSIAFRSGASARGTDSCGAARFAPGAAGFGADLLDAGCFAFAFGATRGAAFFGAAFFAVARFVAVFFATGLRVFGFAF